MEERVKVQISYIDSTVEFTGSPSDVYSQVLSYLEKTIPALSLAHRIIYAPDTQEILETVKGTIAYRPNEGLTMMKPLISFSIADAIILVLLKRYLENVLGIKPEDGVSLGELSELLDKPMKTVSARLSELMRHGEVRRIDKGSYSLTALGLKNALTSSVAREAKL